MAGSVSPLPSGHHLKLGTGTRPENLGHAAVIRVFPWTSKCDQSQPSPRGDVRFAALAEDLGGFLQDPFWHFPIIKGSFGNVQRFLLVGEHREAGWDVLPDSTRMDTISWNTQSQCPKAPRALPRGIPTALTDTQEIEGSGKKEG